jgi:hypothetical protein
MLPVSYSWLILNSRKKHSFSISFNPSYEKLIKLDTNKYIENVYRLIITDNSNF